MNSNFLNIEYNIELDENQKNHLQIFFLLFFYLEKILFPNSPKITFEICSKTLCSTSSVIKHTVLPNTIYTNGKTILIFMFDRAEIGVSLIEKQQFQ